MANSSWPTSDDVVADRWSQPQRITNVKMMAAINLTSLFNRDCLQDFPFQSTKRRQIIMRNNNETWRRTIDEWRVLRESKLRLNLAAILLMLCWTGNRGVGTQNADTLVGVLSLSRCSAGICAKTSSDRTFAARSICGRLYWQRLVFSRENTQGHRCSSWAAPQKGLRLCERSVELTEQREILQRSPSLGNFKSREFREWSQPL